MPGGPQQKSGVGGSEGEVLWSQGVCMVGEDGKRFLPVLHGACVPRALAASALLLISYFLLMVS